MAGWLTRALRPNSTSGEQAAPNTVGDTVATPGDPHGLVVGEGPPPGPPLPTIVPSAWSGWPGDWGTAWGNVSKLADTAWACIDKNASILASMPPYLVGAAPSLNAEWLTNPQPATYASWVEFCKSLFWEYQAAGEAFVLATARYATGWPARFHVLPPWTVTVEMTDVGSRRYLIGQVDVTGDVLHVRYSSTVDDPHGHGPLEAGASRLVAADVLLRYGTNLAASGGVPTSILKHPEQLDADQSATLQAQWVEARTSSLGLPAVLSGGIEWEATQLNPEQLALLELAQWNESRIAVMLGVPPVAMGLPQGGDS